MVDQGGTRKVYTIAKGLHRPNGVAFKDGTLYVADRRPTVFTQEDAWLLLHKLRRNLDETCLLEGLVEAGLAQAHGNARGRSYTLAAGVYQADGDKAAYTRQVGFSALQHEQLVLNYVQQHGRITRAEVVELCRLSVDQAAKLLKKLKENGLIQQHGERRWASYTLLGGEGEAL